MMKKYKYLLWDLDGTLTDSLPGVAQGLNIVFDHFNITVDTKEYPKYVGPPLRTSFAKHFAQGEEMEEALRVFRSYYNVEGIYKAELFEGIKDTLLTLKCRGYIMYVATSKREAVAQEVIKNFGLLACFDKVYGADDTIGIIEKEDVLNKIFSDNPHITKSECLMIGDTIYDANGAKIMGIDFFAALYGFGNNKEVMSYNPVGCVNAPIEYLEVFK